MINEIFAGRDPVIPLPLMTQAQKDNELERIFEDMHVRKGFCEDCQIEVSIIEDPIHRRYKRSLATEFDRGYKFVIERASLDSGWFIGYEEGYKNGRDAEARHRDKV